MLKEIYLTMNLCSHQHKGQGRRAVAHCSPEWQHCPVAGAFPVCPRNASPPPPRPGQTAGPKLPRTSPPSLPPFLATHKGLHSVGEKGNTLPLARLSRAPHLPIEGMCEGMPCLCGCPHNSGHLQGVDHSDVTVLFSFLPLGKG